MAVQTVRALRAVLFDVGGPLNTEATHERLVDEHLRAAFAAEGLPVADGAYERACQFAVDSFAPDAPKAIVWHFTAPDTDAARRVFGRFRAALTADPGYNCFQVRPGASDLLERLHGRGSGRAWSRISLPPCSPRWTRTAWAATSPTGRCPARTASPSRTCAPSCACPRISACGPRSVCWWGTASTTTSPPPSCCAPGATRPGGPAPGRSCRTRRPTTPVASGPRAGAGEQAPARLKGLPGS